MLAPSRSFFCLRHGATDWNRHGLFQGRTDNPLNDDGIAQAHAAAEKLQAVSRSAKWSSSPLLARAEDRGDRRGRIVAAASPSITA